MKLDETRWAHQTWFQVAVRWHGAKSCPTQNCCSNDRLRRQFSSLQVIRRRHAKGVGNTIEEGKHGRDVHSFRNLILTPPEIPQSLNIFVGRTVCSVGDQLNVTKQADLPAGKSCFIQLTFQDGLNTFIGCSLNTQEVSMAVQSIWTAVQIRDVTGNHLLVPTRKMPFREVDFVRDLNHLS